MNENIDEIEHLLFIVLYHLCTYDIKYKRKKYRIE